MTKKIPSAKSLTEGFLFIIGLESRNVESSRDDFFSVTMRTFVGDNAGVAANGVAVDGVIDRKISHVGIVHCSDQCLERRNIFRRVAVHFYVRYMHLN